jgi:hypothetical protein
LRPGPVVAKERPDEKVLAAQRAALARVDVRVCSSARTLCHLGEDTPVREAHCF